MVTDPFLIWTARLLLACVGSVLLAMVIALGALWVVAGGRGAADRQPQSGGGRGLATASRDRA
jgi:hypothetical protein